MIISFLLILSFLTISLSATAQEYLPKWQEGYLDFHSISTGQGESTFIKMPDGTTMLVDAGDVGEQWTKVHLPDSSKAPGEWIAHYMRHFSQSLRETGKADYSTASDVQPGDTVLLNSFWWSIKATFIFR